MLLVHNIALFLQYVWIYFSPCIQRKISLAAFQEKNLTSKKTYTLWRLERNKNGLWCTYIYIYTTCERWRLGTWMAVVTCQGLSMDNGVNHSCYSWRVHVSKEWWKSMNSEQMMRAESFKYASRIQLHWKLGSAPKNELLEFEKPSQICYFYVATHNDLQNVSWRVVKENKSAASWRGSIPASIL
jgi:hypothetical protein